MRNTGCVVALLAALVLAPLERAHSHNDYRQPRPLEDALAQGFGSVEADIFLVDGELRVGHDRSELRPGRTLERLYLDPLLARVRKNGGTVHPGGTRFILLIDLKADGERVYAELKRRLPAYREMLAGFADGRRTPGAVTAILSGDRPIATVRSERNRWVFLDGRPSDLGKGESPDLFPLISDAWPNHGRWLGVGPMPTADRQAMRDRIARAHAEGKWFRFWASGNQPAMWRELRDAGADLINVDDLRGLRALLEPARD